MKKLILTLILGYSLIINVLSQKEDIKYAAFNVVSSGIIGGIGSGIHKKQGETFGKAFINGFWRGSIAGSLNTISKQLLISQSENSIELNWKLCWSSKIVNSFSNTILYNATMNEPKLFKNYNINIGFIRLSTNKIIQIDPISFGCTAYALLNNGRFDLNRSLIVGTPIFIYEFKIISSYTGNSTFYKPKHLAQSWAQNIIIQKNMNLNYFVIHEIVHTYQRIQYSQINNLLKLYNKFENFKFIHNDFSSFDILYFLQNKTIGYTDNLFEKEAEFYSPH